MTADQRWPFASFELSQALLRGRKSSPRGESPLVRSAPRCTSRGAAEAPGRGPGGVPHQSLLPRLRPAVNLPACQGIRSDAEEALRAPRDDSSPAATAVDALVAPRASSSSATTSPTSSRSSRVRPTAYAGLSFALNGEERAARRHSAVRSASRRASRPTRRAGEGARQGDGRAHLLRPPQLHPLAVEPAAQVDQRRHPLAHRVARHRRSVPGRRDRWPRAVALNLQERRFADDPSKNLFDLIGLGDDFTPTLFVDKGRVGLAKSPDV